MLTVADFDERPTVEDYRDAVQERLRTGGEHTAELEQELEQELGPFGFQAYFRLLGEILGDEFTQDLFVEETQNLAEQWGAPFVWENAFQDADDKYKQAAQWALALFDEMTLDWSYCEKSEWWEAEKAAFVQHCGPMPQ